MTLKAWQAGFTRRWHNHPVMCDTDDPDSGHMQRVTILLLSFWPDAPRDLIVAAVTHDQGEIDSGDVSYTLKRRRPDIAAALHEIEEESIAEQGFPPVPSDPRLKFCDSLDSYLWMLRYKPFLTERDEWRRQKGELWSDAIGLGVHEKFENLLGGAEVIAGVR